MIIKKVYEKITSLYYLLQRKEWINIIIFVIFTKIIIFVLKHAK